MRTLFHRPVISFSTRCGALMGGTRLTSLVSRRLLKISFFYIRRCSFGFRFRRLELPLCVRRQVPSYLGAHEYLKSKNKERATGVLPSAVRSLELPSPSLSYSQVFLFTHDS